MGIVPVRNELCCLLFDAAWERAVQALVEHQCFQHVAGDVRAADSPDYAGASLAAANQHEVAQACVALRFAAERDAVAWLEQRLGDDQAAALGEDADDGVDRAPGGAAHFSLPESPLSATGSASSLFAVFGLSVALT